MFRLLLWMVAVLMAVPASADSITFDSVTSFGNPDISSLTTEGFTFTSEHFHTVDTPSLCAFGGCVPNMDGSTVYISEEAGSLGSPITMVATSGSPFLLNSFWGTKEFLDDAAALAGGFPNAATIHVTGVFDGGGGISTSFGLNGSSNFQFFALSPAWSNLASVTFSGTICLACSPGGMSLDNINVHPIPEPGSLLLLGSGLAGLAGFARRKIF